MLFLLWPARTYEQEKRTVLFQRVIYEEVNLFTPITTTSSSGNNLDDLLLYGRMTPAEMAVSLLLAAILLTFCAIGCYCACSTSRHTDSVRTAKSRSRLRLLQSAKIAESGGLLLKKGTDHSNVNVHHHQQQQPKKLTPSKSRRAPSSGRKIEKQRSFTGGKD